jgi:hypothetical protein
VIRLAFLPARAGLFCVGFGLAAAADACQAGVNVLFGVERSLR